MEREIEYTDKGKKKVCFTFNKISSSETAYLIGYLACDGGFVNCKYPFIQVSSTEFYIIESFRNRYCPNKNIYNLGKKSSALVKATNDIFELRFPRKMNNSFNKFGLLRYKNKRRVVNIPNKFIYPYIAGCIDSDGFISTTFRKDCRSPRLRFFITHGSELFLADLQDILDNLGLPTTLRQHGSNVWRLQAQHTEKNIVFLYNISKYLKNKKKIKILFDYLSKYYVLQESGELLEPIRNQQPSLIEEEGSETT